MMHYKNELPFFHAFKYLLLSDPFLFNSHIFLLSHSYYTFQSVTCPMGMLFEGADSNYTAIECSAERTWSSTSSLARFACKFISEDILEWK